MEVLYAEQAFLGFSILVRFENLLGLLVMIQSHDAVHFDDAESM
jgi:hypothetical protein